MMAEDIQSDPIYALANAGTGIFAGRASGLYVSHGASWQNVLDQPVAVTAATAAGETVFAGLNGAVARSEDGGATWVYAALASPPPLVTALALSPDYQQDGMVVAATAQDGVLLSPDRGVSWTAWNFGLIDQHAYALLMSPSFGTDRTILVGAESGIFRSQNGGRGWQEVDVYKRQAQG